MVGRLITQNPEIHRAGREILRCGTSYGMLDPTAVATSVESAISAAALPRGVQLRPGSCNRQPAFATYQPDERGRLVAGGLLVRQLGEVDGRILITALVSYRDPALAVRCGLPEVVG